jgi:hypothetical protein
LLKKALKAGIEVVTFDRGGYLYHGRIKSLEAQEQLDLNSIYVYVVKIQECRVKNQVVLN